MKIFGKIKANEWLVRWTWCKWMAYLVIIISKKDGLIGYEVKNKEEKNVPKLKKVVTDC